MVKSGGCSTMDSTKLNGSSQVPTAPTISIEDHGEGDHATEDELEQEHSNSPFLLVPPVKSQTPVEEDAGTRPSKLRIRPPKQRIMKRRDTPPIKDSINKLHLSPRGSRKLINADSFNLCPLSEDNPKEGSQPVQTLSPRSQCKVFMQQLNKSMAPQQLNGDTSPKNPAWKLSDYGVRSAEIRPKTPTKQHLDFIKKALSPLTSPSTSPGLSPQSRRRAATVSGGESSITVARTRQRLTNRCKSDSTDSFPYNSASQESLGEPKQTSLLSPSSPSKKSAKSVTWNIDDIKLPPIETARQEATF